MTINENNYYIYIRSTKEKITCTQEEFNDYYRGINAFRKAQQRSMNCVCPANKRLECDMDCLTCPYYRRGITWSLEYTRSDNDNSNDSQMDHLKDTSSPVDEMISDVEEMKCLFKRLEVLMPQAIEIGKLRQEGLTEDAIAEKIGTPRSTYTYRLKKVQKILKEEFPELF